MTATVDRPASTAAPARARTSTRRVVLVANPRASGVTPALMESARRALSRWGASVTVLAPDGAAEWASVAPAFGRRVVLLGGDGTVHAAANLASRRHELALLPAGRSNNVARSLGIPLDLTDAARLAVEGEVRPIDLIEARSPAGRYLTVEGVSVGFLAQARVRYHEENSSHAAAGLAAGAGALRCFHPLAVRVMRPNTSEVLELGQLFVANLALYEFGLRVAPFADPTDELLDVIGVEVPSRLRVPAMILRLRRARHLDHDGVHLWRARHARIETHALSPVVADSTDLGPGPVDLTVLPRALPLVRPR